MVIEYLYYIFITYVETCLYHIFYSFYVYLGTYIYPWIYYCVALRVAFVFSPTNTFNVV